MPVAPRFDPRPRLAVLAPGALAAALPSGARAFVEQGGSLHSGPFGLTPGQVARLGVPHLGDAELSCAFEVVAVDDGGRTIRRAALTVDPGRPARLDLPCAALAAAP